MHSVVQAIDFSKLRRSGISTVYDITFTATYYEVLIIIHFRTFEHARKPAFGNRKNYCRSLLLKERATKTCIKNLDFAH